MSLRRAASSKACVPPIQKPIVATAPSTSGRPRDRKSTRLNSSHSQISYAVFCLKKKKNLPLTFYATKSPAHPPPQSSRPRQAVALRHTRDQLSCTLRGLERVAGPHPAVECTSPH